MQRAQRKDKQDSRFPRIAFFANEFPLCALGVLRGEICDSPGGRVMSFRYAICNETYGDWDHERVCKHAANLGYTGLEIAPFTLAPLITDVSPARRQIIRKQAEDAGLTIVGLHWLLAKTTGFQITSPEIAVRQGTAKYLGELAKCCREDRKSTRLNSSHSQISYA